MEYFFRGKGMRKRLVVAVIMMASLISVSCSSGTIPPTSTSSPIPTSSPTSPSATNTYSQYQLEYRLLAAYPDIFWCDPDFYPIAREGQEQANALQQFPVIMANTAEFIAILEHLALPNKTDYTDAEKLDIYRQHKLLTRAITVTFSGNIYDFSLRTGQNPGWHFEGTITPYGQIKETKKETSFNTCPICLARGTPIGTPGGAVPVEDLKPGMIVWTLDKMGQTIAAPIIKTSSTQVPPSFQVVKLTLHDGQSVTASPGHPTAEMRALGDYHIGDYLGSSLVISVERIACTGDATYDLLPDGETGLYWANGILLMSTLARNW